MDPETKAEPKSKSQVKREMTALQVLGERLLELSRQQLERIEMPPELREAVESAKTLKSHEARRRQLQYIGTLMRDADPEPIRKAIEEIGDGGLQNAQLRKLERWRDALIEGNAELLADILEQYPAADRQKLRQLTLKARKEKEADSPPAASRALFRYLRQLTKPQPSDAAEGINGDHPLG